MTKRQSIIVAVGVFIIMILAGGFFANLKKQPPKLNIQAPPKYVKTIPVTYSEIKSDIITYGRVLSAQPVDLIAEVSGRILPGRVALKVGQDFNTGTLLFRIEDSEASLNLKAMKSNFLRDLATILPDLKIDFPDAYPKWNSYFQSIDIDAQLPELPKHESDKEKTFLATNNIFSNYFDIKRSETNLSKHFVYGPFSGSFSDVWFEPGAYVNPGNKIGRIIRHGKLELVVPVEATDIRWIKSGAQALVSTEDGARTWEGTIKRIGDVVNETTQSIDVVMDIVPNQHPIYDGLYLKAVIPGVTVPEAMEIDRSAFYNGSEVYTVENDSILKVKEINVLRLNSETVIFNGLAEGEELVVDPLINAYNNMAVTTGAKVDSAQNTSNATAQKGS